MPSRFFFLAGIVVILRSFLLKQFLPLGLISAALVGFLFPEPGLYMAELPTQYVAVALIFVVSGLGLRTDEVRTAVSAWRATLWGAVSILFITPVIGAFIAFRLPLEPHFQLGLALFCCMPTTLSSGIALTNQAKGNVALALLLTVVTNVVGLFTIPFLLAWLLKTGSQTGLSAGDLLVKLCYFILLPLVVGKYLRRVVGAWADCNRGRLGIASNVALISIPWMKFSQSSDHLARIALASLVLLVVSGLAIHVLYLVFNDGICRILRLDLSIRRAVVLMASQKTLPVAMTVLAFLPLPAASRGLVAIPCITFHLGQIFLDAVIATRWGTAPRD